MNKIEDLYWKIHYTLLDWRNEVKWAWQRVFRGYDDTAYWCLNDYLAKIINQVTFKLVNEGSGHPTKLTEKKWKNILNQISFGFGSYLEIQSGFYDEKDPEYKRLEREFQKGLELFCKYYNNLWD